MTGGDVETGVFVVTLAELTRGIVIRDASTARPGRGRGVRHFAGVAGLTAVKG